MDIIVYLFKTESSPYFNVFNEVVQVIMKHNSIYKATSGS